MMKKLATALAVVAVLAASSVAVAFAQTPGSMMSGQNSGGHSFQMGFAMMANQMSNIVGQPMEGEHYGPNGDSLQQTTTGMMVWRKADNWTAFTDGSRTWVNGPMGIQMRFNDQRFDWEAR